MSDNFEVQHGHHVWKTPLHLDADGVLHRLHVSRPRWRVIASILPTEQDASIDAATFLAAIEGDILNPIDSRKSRATWAICACKLPSTIKPKADHTHGHSAGLGHVCNVRRCARSAEGIREIVAVLRRSCLLSRYHFYTYSDADLRRALTWLIWSAWDRLFDAADDSSVVWTRALPEVVAELRSIAMRNLILTAPQPEAPTLH